MTLRSFRWLPDTIVVRAVMILAGALISMSLVGYWVYRVGAEGLATTARDKGLAERIVSIKRAVTAIPDEIERDKAAHALATASLEVHWSKVSLVLGNAPVTVRSRAMEARLKELVPEFGAESFRVGYADDGALNAGEGDAYRHMLLVSVKLEDGTWLNFASPTFGTAHHMAGNILAIAAIVGSLIILIAILLLRWVTRPLRDLAIAAERFSLDEARDPVSESGPAEVRRAAKAFNTMGERVRRLVSERTMALAAVSHDLRTPITRLRLRSELLDDEQTRNLIDDDLAEMEAMINSTLEFLRMGVPGDETKAFDLATMLRTIVDGEADRGRSISLKGIEHASMLGKPVAVKRALWNIIGNALKYGGTVTVHIKLDDAHVLVEVLDDGPGIPDAEFEKVFEPFYRVEISRSRQTGGTGLGLTIAKAILSEHGGTIELHNRQRGGLRVSVRLPVKPAETVMPTSRKREDAQSGHGHQNMRS
ncbi:MAG: integral membrane sensor signal transduction histidine [Beijerinckiaceae bacterium]|nr:MAG: integral membrane sensor signal transduction histidine [Beijerinckiaceae bacterium]